MTTYIGPNVFSKPTKTRSYIKILSFVHHNPGCSRKEIHRRVFSKEYTKSNRADIYAGLLRYGKMTRDGVKYYITSSGLTLLETAGVKT